MAFVKACIKSKIPNGTNNHAIIVQKLSLGKYRLAQVQFSGDNNGAWIDFITQARCARCNFGMSHYVLLHVGGETESQNGKPPCVPQVNLGACKFI